MLENLLESLQKVRYKTCFSGENGSLNKELHGTTLHQSECQFQCKIMTQHFQTHLFKTFTHLISLTCKRFQKKCLKKVSLYAHLGKN